MFEEYIGRPCVLARLRASAFASDLEALAIYLDGRGHRRTAIRSYLSAAAHLAELADHLDLDGNLLITNDPFEGVTAENGILSFTQTKVKAGLCASPRDRNQQSVSQ